MTKREIRLWALALMVPALLSGCGVINAVTGGGASSAPDGAAAGGNAQSWIVGATGSATPSPGSPGGSPTPSATSGFLPLGTGGPATTATPSPTCSANTFSFSKIGGMDVTPARTSAVLSWYNVGGFNLVEFRLYAISQDLVPGKQRDVGFVTVKPTTCGQMTATITKLSPKTHYVFSADAVVTRRSGDGTHAATVARSYSIQTK